MGDLNFDDGTGRSYFSHFIMANNSLKQKSKRLMTIITYSIPNICQSHLSFKNWKVCHQDPFSISAIAVAQSSDVFLISNVFLRILLNVQAHQNGFIPLVASWCSTGFVGEFGRYQRQYVNNSWSSKKDSTTQQIIYVLILSGYHLLLHRVYIGTLLRKYLWWGCY